MRIEIKDLHLGGLSDSKYSGLPNSAYKIEGFNLHEEPGVMKVQQAIKDDYVSGDLITSKVRAIVPAGSNTFLFSGDTIVKRNSSAVYTNDHTVIPGTGADIVLDAAIFNGRIYYTTAQTVGYYDISADTYNDAEHALSFDDEFHPLIVIENDLYIGNANKVAKIDPLFTFTADALELDSKYTIQSFGKLIDHLIIGTITEGTSAGSFSGFSEVFNWDLRSIDLTSQVTLPEFGINAFLDYSGAILIQAGKQGNWYSYNGTTATNFKRFPGDWSGTKAGVTEANAISSYRGIPIIGFSNESGNPTLQGLYSLGGYDAKYPTVFNFDFPSVLGGSDDTEIGAIARIGTDLVFSRTVSSNHKVMRIDLSNKYDGANIETQVINVDRDKWKSSRVKICYRSLPAGSTITLGQKTNDATGYSNVTLTDYSNKKYLETNVKLFKANNIQFKVSTTRGTDTNTAPEIMSIIIDFDESEK